MDYFNGPEYSDKDLGFDDGFDVFGEPTNAQTMQQLEKEDIDNNIGGKQMLFKVERSAVFNFQSAKFEISEIPYTEDSFKQWNDFANMVAKSLHKSLQEDYPKEEKFTKKTFDNGVKHNVPTNNYNNNYNNQQAAPQQNKQFPDMIPCQCGSNMVLSKYPNGNPKTTKDKSRAEYKCSCGKFKWQ